MATFDLPNTITIDGIARDVAPIDLDLSEVTAETIEAAIIFALRSKISNAFASKQDADIETLTDIAHAHVASLENNEFRLGSGFGGTLDPVTKELREHITNDARKRYGEKAVDAKKTAMAPAAYFARVASTLGTTPDKIEAAFVAAATKIVEARKAVASDIEISL